MSNNLTYGINYEHAAEFHAHEAEQFLDRADSTYTEAVEDKHVRRALVHSALAIAWALQDISGKL